jgi:hypothetical protein
MRSSGYSSSGWAFMNTTFFLRGCWGAIAAISFLAGCTSYEVKVDAIARRAPSPTATVTVNPNTAMAAGTSYWIRSRNGDVADDELRFKEAAGHVRTALSAHGLWLAPNASEADLVVDLDCGIGPPCIVEETMNVPVLGSRNPGAEDLGPLMQSPDGTVHIRPVGGATFDVVDYEEATHGVVVYEKHLSVTCRENRASTAGKPPLELWSVSATIESESKDLRESLPVLAAAVMVKLGQTTDGLVTDRLSKSDDAIGFVKAGM